MEFEPGWTGEDNHLNISSSFSGRRGGGGEDDEEALRWAAIESLPVRQCRLPG